MKRFIRAVLPAFLLAVSVGQIYAFTTLAIFLLVLTFNHLADYLRDRLDPALRGERG